MGWTQGFETALIQALSQVQGAYSMLLLTQDQIIGARDPNGFRPLVPGEIERGLCAGFRDLRPGFGGGPICAGYRTRRNYFYQQERPSLR